MDDVKIIIRVDIIYLVDDVDDFFIFVFLVIVVLMWIWV